MRRFWVICDAVHGICMAIELILVGLVIAFVVIVPILTLAWIIRVVARKLIAAYGKSRTREIKEALTRLVERRQQRCPKCKKSALHYKWREWTICLNCDYYNEAAAAGADHCF